MVTVSTVDGARSCGPIEMKVRSDVDALVTEHPMGESLAEMAFALARRLDDRGSTKDLAVAGISKELRETLLALAGMGVEDDDLGDSLSVPTAFRDAAQS